MKKYTNKILIIAAAIFLVAITTWFFIVAHEVKKAIEQSEPNELIINQKETEV